MGETLDKLLHGPGALPVLVKADGTFETAAYPPAKIEDYAPESISIDYDGGWGMPDILESHERDALASIGNGWQALTGWADDGSLFIFRSDRERFGSALEDHIRETPGLWSVVSVEMYSPCCDAGDDGMPCADYDEREYCEHAEYAPESKDAGWALVHKEITEGGQ